MSFWLSLAGLGLLVLMWASALLKMLRGDDQPPEFTLGADTPPDPLPDPPPSLSVVVPARNEAANIEACVRSEVAPTGACTMFISTPWSSSGRKPVGVRRNSSAATTPSTR